MRAMRQQEYNEIHDIKRNLAFFVVVLLAIMSLVVISADASEECVGWEWRQTGYHNECSGWYCWTVPEYSFVCTGYSPEPELPAPIRINSTDKNIIPLIEQKPTSIGFSYSFGSNDTDRYQIMKEQHTQRANYIMENIAWSHGLYPDEFEKKYNIR
jgi:hypothetical protein